MIIVHWQLFAIKTATTTMLLDKGQNPVFLLVLVPREHQLESELSLAGAYNPVAIP